MTKINIKGVVENLVDTFLSAGKISLDLRNKGLIKEIKSDSKNEFSSIKIEFNLNRDMDSAANDVREKVSRVSSLLPKLSLIHI